MRWPPHFVHHFRKLTGVLLYVAMSASPLVILTAVGGHSVNALTGPADQLRHDRQWQNHIAAGWPVTVSSTAPQKQLPLYVCSLLMWALQRFDARGYGHRSGNATPRARTRNFAGDRPDRVSPPQETLSPGDTRCLTLAGRRPRRGHCHSLYGTLVSARRVSSWQGGMLPRM